MVKSKTLEGKVFISYKNNPDNVLAQTLYESLLQSTSYKLWFDSSNLLGGQPYNRRIPEAIKFSQIFIPVLTSSIATLLKNYTIEELKEMNLSSGLPFFIQEWKWASAVNGIVIIPISFDGYDLRGPEHMKFESIIYGNEKSSHPSGIHMGNQEAIDPKSIEKLVISINNALGINE